MLMYVNDKINQTQRSLTTTFSDDTYIQMETQCLT